MEQGVVRAKPTVAAVRMFQARMRRRCRAGRRGRRYEAPAGARRGTRRAGSRRFAGGSSRRIAVQETKRFTAAIRAETRLHRNAQKPSALSDAKPGFWQHFPVSAAAESVRTRRSPKKPQVALCLTSERAERGCQKPDSATYRGGSLARAGRAIGAAPGSSYAPLACMMPAANPSRSAAAKRYRTVCTSPASACSTRVKRSSTSAHPCDNSAYA